MGSSLFIEIGEAIQFSSFRDNPKCLKLFKNNNIVNDIIRSINSDDVTDKCQRAEDGTH